MPRGDVIHHPRSPSTWLLVCVHCPARYVGGHWSIAMAVCQPRVKWHRIGRNHNSGDFSVMGEMYNISYPCKYRQFIITGRYTVKNDTSNVVLIDLVCRPISLLTLSCLSWLSFVSSSKTTSIVITLTSLSTDSFISIDHILPRHIALCQQLKHPTPCIPHIKPVTCFSNFNDRFRLLYRLRVFLLHFIAIHHSFSVASLSTAISSFLTISSICSISIIAKLTINY